MSDPRCLESTEFDVSHLASSHPPVWKHPLKQKAHDFVRANGNPLTGVLRYSRWDAAGLPEIVRAHSLKVEVEADVYSYPQATGADWHVNFADPNLFVAYGSGLLAQDELQALEHPVLGSLREALLDSGRPPRTRENGRSTPILVAGAFRQCALDTFPDPDQRRPRGLYGNHFQQASWPSVQSALTVLRPATITNLICISAPTGSGRYATAQIHDALETAYTGMRAAIAESRGNALGESVTLHTGSGVAAPSEETVH